MREIDLSRFLEPLRTVGRYLNPDWPFRNGIEILKDQGYSYQRVKENRIVLKPLAKKTEENKLTGDNGGWLYVIRCQEECSNSCPIRKSEFESTRESEPEEVTCWGMRKDRDPFSALLTGVEKMTPEEIMAFLNSKLTPCSDVFRRDNLLGKLSG